MTRLPTSSDAPPTYQPSKQGSTTSNTPHHTTKVIQQPQTLAQTVTSHPESHIDISNRVTWILTSRIAQDLPNFSDMTSYPATRSKNQPNPNQGASSPAGQNPALVAPKTGPRCGCNGISSTLKQHGYSKDL